MDDELKQSFGANFRSDAKFLILGSLPGDASLRRGEYYAHPRNVFWRMMGEIFGFSPELPYRDRLDCLADHGVALWDVVARGVRPGSLDAAIRRAELNDIPGLLKMAPGIVRIGCNGGCSYELLMRNFPDFGVEVCRLPSTSPAAAMYTYEEKRKHYEAFLK